MIRHSRINIFLAVLLLSISGCSKDDLVSPYPQYNDAIPSDALLITDGYQDLSLAAEGPPSLIQYDPVDVRRVYLWKADGYFYIHVDFAGLIPTSPPIISGQNVNQQGFNVSIDTDNNQATGASVGGIGGVDIFFAVLIRYGQPPSAPYANFNFQTQDIHTNAGHLEGELRNGGPGTTYVTYRFSLSIIGSLLPANRQVVVGGWSEAESSSYHHFAFDDYPTVFWLIPQ